MTNKTTKELFTEEFLQDLIFLIDNFNIQEEYRETIVETPTFDDPYRYECDEDLEYLCFKFEDLLEDMQEKINNYFNIDFDEFSEFLYENQKTSSCDLEAKFNQYLQNYLD
jgi:hypothetical protein